MSGKQSGKGAKGDDAVDVVSIAVLESKVEIPLVDSTATLLTQSEKQTAAEMEAPRVPDGEDVDGSRDRAVTGRAERSMKAAATDAGSGRTYYYNAETGATSWDWPPREP